MEADPTVAGLLREYGYMTAQYGKNHLGDLDEHLPTNHGFDELFGNLYHLNAEEEPENPDYPKDPAFKEKFGPRGVIRSTAGGDIVDTGPLTKKRMDTIDEEVTDGALDFIDRAHDSGKPFFLWWNSTRMHIDVWQEPFVELRLPKLVSLRSDPFERAHHEGMGYQQWRLERAFMLVPAQAFVANWLASFQQFPPRQKPGSFSLSQVMDKLSEISNK